MKKIMLVSLCLIAFSGCISPKIKEDPAINQMESLVNELQKDNLSLIKENVALKKQMKEKEKTIKTLNHLVQEKSWRIREAEKKAEGK